MFIQVHKGIDLKPNTISFCSEKNFSFNSKQNDFTCLIKGHRQELEGMQTIQPIQADQQHL